MFPGHKIHVHYVLRRLVRDGIFKLFKEPRNRFKGIDSARLCSRAGRYYNPILTRFLAQPRQIVRKFQHCELDRQHTGRMRKRDNLLTGKGGGGREESLVLQNPFKYYMSGSHHTRQVLKCPQPECNQPNSPQPGIIKLFPAMESLVSVVLAGDREIANLCAHFHPPRNKKINFIRQGSLDKGMYLKLFY